MRPGLTHLYTLSVDRPNIRQFVATIMPKKLRAVDRQSEYVQLEMIYPRSGSVFFVPKTMIFVDSIDKAHNIAIYLQEAMLARFLHHKNQMSQPFSSNLEADTRTEFMEAFRSGVIRIMICTDTAGMGVDIPDVDLVIQWRLHPHLTVAYLWQWIGRAGRLKTRIAVAVIFVEPWYMLPESLPPGSVFTGYQQPGCPGNEEIRIVVRQLVEQLYTERDCGKKTKTGSCYERIDPPLFFNLNTTGCRCREVMAGFVDAAAFEGTRESDCCDNILYLNSGREIPDLERHGVSAKVSVRYTVSAQYWNEISDRANVINGRPKDKPSSAERAVVLKAIDHWLRPGWEQNHGTKLSRGSRDDIVRDCRNISSVSDLQRTLPKLSLIHSAVGPRATNLVTTIQDALATVPQPVAPPPERNPPIHRPRIQPPTSQCSDIYSKAVIQNPGQPNSRQFQVARVPFNPPCTPEPPTPE